MRTLKRKLLITLKHQTSKRRRYGCSGISIRSDINAILVCLESIEGVNNAKINAKARTFTLFLGDKANVKKIEKELNNIDFASFKTDKKITAQSDASAAGAAFLRSALIWCLLPFAPAKSVKLALSLFSAAPILLKGADELLQNGVNSEFLEAAAVGVSLARGDFAAANSTNALLELGEYIEELTVQKSNDLIKELSKPNIDKVWIETYENKIATLKQVSVNELNIGDIVVVGAGETIAIDGAVIAGDALVNQASMTGESEPIRKERGERALSGTVVKEGQIKIWAENVGANTATARIKNYILNAIDEKSSIGLKASNLADKLVPVTLSLSVLSYLLSGKMQNVAAVLQADYSCSLKLATPIAFKSSIAQAAKENILVKGAKVLETLAMADTFVFDKTGTLTYGELEVVSVKSFDKNWSEEEILNITASAEEHYFHPVAESVVKAAKERGFVHKHHEEVEFITAHGVQTTIGGKIVIIGSRHFLEDDNKIDFSAKENEIAKSLDDGKTLLYVGYDGKLLGMIEMFDKIRSNAKDVIQKIRSLGAKKIVMLTGDITSRAEAISKELGLDEVYANMLPNTKADIVSKLKQNGEIVVFIGDGINDAPPLMCADVGISMFKGADIAKAAADISLLREDIEALINVKILANKTMEKINGNFKAAVSINSAILLGAASGLLSPVVTAALHNGTTIALLLNAIRKFDKKKLKF